MKSKLLLFAMFLTGISLYSQQSPERYLSSVPRYYGNHCNISDADTVNIRLFHEKMSAFRDSLGSDLERRKDLQESFMENNADQIRENVLEQQGFSKEDAKKLKNADEMSEDEKMAIANKMLMEKMGMDIGDFKKLAEMDTASQKRWAQGYGTMKMADAMANPQQSQDEQKRNKDQFDLLTEQQALIEKIRAAESKYFQQLDTLQKEADSAYAELSREFGKMHKQMDDCDSEECMESFLEQMNQMKKDFCYRFSPDYWKIVGNFKSYLVASLDTYDELDVLSNQVTESQTGIRNLDFKPGISALYMIKIYAGLEAAIFKFYHAEAMIGIGEAGTISN